VTQIDQIRTVRASVRATVAEIGGETGRGPVMLLLNPRLDSRCCQGTLEVIGGGGVRLDLALAEALALRVGDPVRYVTMRGSATLEHAPGER
jgi:arginine/ornithine N-succinyltransferase beta subunit